MTKYRYTIYRYSPSMKRNLKTLQECGYTKNIRSIMKEVKELKKKYKVMRINGAITVCFDKVK